MYSGKFFTYPSPINSTFCPKWAVSLLEHWVKGRVGGQSQNPPTPPLTQHFAIHLIKEGVHIGLGEG